ncbi:hypothetical protein OG911_43825 [Streptomyces sp. NBC_00208]|uniref:hypothetical protein n=1 Tax=Streptomyces sp. NBC_00208 TaxID=2975681 RepID=UPI002E29896E|nr:hypothetical protein [Streptomyces sp. NBC_00208]
MAADHDALTNTGTEDEYHARQGQHRQEREAQDERRNQAHEEEARRQKAGKWACPSCGGPVYLGDAWGEAATPGGLCTAERSLNGSSQQPQSADRAVSAAEAAESNGIPSSLRRRQPLAKPGCSLVAGVHGREVVCVGA